MRKIGFLSYDNDEKSTSNADSSSNAITAKELFGKFLTNKYDAFGPDSAMIFRTSRELVYECREMCEPSLPDVAKVMDDLGFKSDQFCGQYTWVLYEKEELRY
ncbi:hypothetical protein [Bacteroides salyersiae]|uniref:hypothetical protein n=1 Tax=Bacteroides salyersiae TaxID=291644 RepID=UPI0018996A97|nr:hypothetical protein [Bacteroides salyersiae]